MDKKWMYYCAKQPKIWQSSSMPPTNKRTCKQELDAAIQFDEKDGPKC